MFLATLFSDPQYYLWVVMIVLFSVVMHELFHALAAWWQGDETAKEMGYITMNPVTHMGVQSIVLLMLFGLCWGACPVNPARLKYRYSDAIVSFAGPFANLLLMTLAILLINLLFLVDFGLSSGLEHNIQRFFSLAALTNAALFVLNMIPLPPFDGHKVVENIFPQTFFTYQKLGQNAGLLVMVALFIFPPARLFFWMMAEGLTYGVGSSLAWLIYG